MENKMENLGFIGGGVMAQAMCKGFIHKGMVRDASSIFLYDPFPPARESCATLGVNVVDDIYQVVTKCQIVIIAVKPQVVDEVLTELDHMYKTASEITLLTICAGITISTILKATGIFRVCRAMPNTACSVEESATAYCLSGILASCPVSRTRVVQLLQSLGLAYEVTEDKLDAVTGLSGSGPAFVFRFLEAMSDGGVLKGLPRNVASGLALQTLIGAAKMVQKTGTHPALLVEQVTCPGGTTIAGLSALEQHRFKHAVISAIDAASTRSQELGAPADVNETKRNTTKTGMSRSLFRQKERKKNHHDDDDDDHDDDHDDY